MNHNQDSSLPLDSSRPFGPLPTPSRLVFPDPVGFQSPQIYAGNRGQGFKAKSDKHPLGLLPSPLNCQQFYKMPPDRPKTSWVVSSQRNLSQLEMNCSTKTFNTLDTQMARPQPVSQPQQLQIAPKKMTPDDQAALFSEKTVANASTFGLLEPFIKLSSHSNFALDPMETEDCLFENERETGIQIHPDSEPEEELIGCDTSLDVPPRDMTTQQFSEKYLDDLHDSLDAKMLEAHEKARARQSDRVPCVALQIPEPPIHASEGGEMEVESEGNCESDSQTQKSIPLRKAKAGGSCCTCKKSKCLKLYCECFRTNGFCGEGCSCTECYNRKEFADVRDQFYLEQLQRNPGSFSSKIVALPHTHIYSRGCNCKKTECQKNYCECFAAGVKCSSLCRCTECGNLDPNMPGGSLAALQERQIKKRRKSEKNFQDSLRERLASRKLAPDGHEEG